jgi:hypothetical protein
MHSVTRLLTLYENLQVVNACALFISDDKLHRNFPYMHCWKILKDQPNWLERRKHINAPKPPAKRQKTTAKPSTSADTLAITGDADGDVQTATGAQQRSRKEEREEDIMAMCKHGSDGVPCDKEERNWYWKRVEERWEEQEGIHASGRKNKNWERKVDMQREMDEERIMNIDMSTLSYKQQQYYERRHDEILAKHAN